MSDIVFTGFLPGVPVDISITARERSLSHKFNPLLYTIEVRHGSYQWTIRRRYHHFRKVHAALFVFRTKQLLSGGHASGAKEAEQLQEQSLKRQSLMEKVR